MNPSDLSKLADKFPLSASTRRRNLPSPAIPERETIRPPANPLFDGGSQTGTTGPATVSIPKKPLTNKTEQRAASYLSALGVVGIMEQAITLRLDPPFKSYRPDLAYLSSNGLIFVEVKGPHRFRRAGIAKVALAAKTYPQFRFELYDWIDGLWKVSVMSP